jgi:hypothetical protein
MLHFSVFEEAQKIRDLLISNPPPTAMLCNDEDLKQLPFRPTDLGFFILLVPGKKNALTGSFTYVADERMRDQARAFVTKHTVQQLDERFLLVSTACTWDVVPAKVKKAIAVGYGAMAFTTPERLQILGENPQHMK